MHGSELSSVIQNLLRSIPTFVFESLILVGCLCLFDFMFSQLDAKHLWLNEHAYEIMYLYKYEGIMATILLLIHFISLWLTLMSLLQPCDDNCIKKNCDSTNSHASERILDYHFFIRYRKHSSGSRKTTQIDLVSQLFISLPHESNVTCIV